MTEPKWVRAFALDELAVGDGRLFRQGDQHVAVFRVAEAELYAVDNRCPHEGYPLSKGYVSDCVVTCPWHNFKFDLRDGRCVMGDEEVRTFPLRLAKGDVEIDLADPDPAVERARLLASLEAGLGESKLGQCARDIVRLLQLGMTPAAIALEAVRFDSERAPYGSTHVLPLALDALRIADRFDGVTAVLPLLQIFDQAADSHVRREKRNAREAASFDLDPQRAGQRLSALVEAEDAAAAEALLRGALARGWGRAEIEPWLYRLCADHFLDFGHALIYLVKAFDLLEQVGWQSAEHVLPALLLRIVNATREELLPEWKWFRDGTVSLFADRATIYAGLGERPLDAPALFAMLVDGERREMLAYLERELRSGVRLEDVVDVISAAAAERMLRFSTTIEQDPKIQESWLGVTHTLTFANAVRHALERFRDADVLKLVLYAARFVNNARGVDGPPESFINQHASAEPAAADSIAVAVGTSAQAAVSQTLRYLEDGGDPDHLRVTLEDLILDDAATRPIVVTHLIKTCAAAFEEHRLSKLSPDLRHKPISALLRLLASPVRERSIGRLAHEAIRFVVHGKVPKTLT